MSILLILLLQQDFILAKRLLLRGANVDYVNSNGYTALHLCIENQQLQAIKFLLDNNANPHIMDLSGEDACDKASFLGLQKDYPELNACNLSLKVPPKLPDGKGISSSNLPYFKILKQRKKDQLYGYID